MYTLCQTPALLDERCDDSHSYSPQQRIPPPVWLSLAVCCPGSEGTAILANLQRKVEVDLEVRGDRQATGRYIAWTSPQELHMLGPAFQHVLVGALSNNVVL